MVTASGQLRLPPCCGVGALEVDPHLLPVDLDRRADREVALERLDGLGGRVAPVRHLGDRGAGAPLGVVPDLGARGPPPVRAAASDQLGGAPLGKAVDGELGAQVAAPLVARARVGGDQVDQVVVEPRRRQDQAFLVQLGRVGGHRGGGHPADVGVVRARGGPAQQLAVDVDRRDERDVGQVRAAQERVVEHPDLAGLDVLLAHGGDRGGQRAEVDGDVLGLDDEPAVRVEQRGRAVAPLLDVGRERAVDQRRAHLLGDPAQRADRDLELGGVHVASRVRMPWSSASPDQPGGTRQVVSGNSTIAGPSMVGAGRQAVAGQHLGLDLLAVPADRAAAALDVAGGLQRDLGAGRDGGGAQGDELDRRGRGRRGRSGARARRGRRPRARPGPRTGSAARTTARRSAGRPRRGSPRRRRRARRRARSRPSASESGCSRLREASRRRSAAARPTAESTPLAGRHSTRVAPSWVASSQACSGPAPPKASSEAPAGSCPRSTETTRSACTIALTATATTPSAASSALPMPSDSSAARAASTSSSQVGGDRRLGGQPAEDQVRVGHRGLLAATAVAGRAGVGARALRADAQRAAAVDPRDRAAARADRVDVDHRQADGQPGDLALDGQLGLGAALGEEERVAARAAHVEAERGRLGDDPRRHRAPGGAGEQHRRRVRGRLLERGHPARGEHHVRLGQPGLLAWPCGAGSGSGRSAARARRRPSRSSRARTRAPRRRPRARRPRTRPAARRAGSPPRAPRAPDRGRRTAGRPQRPPRVRARAACAARSTLASSSSRITPSGPIRSSTSTQCRRSTTGGVGASCRR